MKPYLLSVLIVLQLVSLQSALIRGWSYLWKNVPLMALYSSAITVRFFQTQYHCNAPTMKLIITTFFNLGSQNVEQQGW